jgi:hypothetical protein
MDQAFQAQPTEDLSFVADAGAFWNDMDALRDTLQSEFHFEQIVIGTALTGTFTLTAGYVLWAVRGSMLVASLVAQLPAWQVFDPLPILDSCDDERARRQIDKNGSDDSLESMIESSDSHSGSTQ